MECKWTSNILILIILVFALWDNYMYSKWIVIIAAIILLFTTFTCGDTCKPNVKTVPKKKKGKK